MLVYIHKFHSLFIFKVTTSNSPEHAEEDLKTWRRRERNDAAQSVEVAITLAKRRHACVRVRGRTQVYDGDCGWCGCFADGVLIFKRKLLTVTLHIDSNICRVCILPTQINRKQFVIFYFNY